MARSVRPPPPRPPAASGDLDEFVAWCASTQDVMAFQTALKYVAAERWPVLLQRLAAELAENKPQADPGYAAERDARGRAAARRHKLALLARHEPSTPTPDRPGRRPATARYGQ